MADAPRRRSSARSRGRCREHSRIAASASKTFGSWGIFYDFFKLELPCGSFGGDKWIEYHYTLDTFDWPNLPASSACPPECPGALIKSTDFRHPSFGSDTIDPDLKPMRLQEATAGIDHELNSQLAVGVHHVHKQIDTAIEDTGHPMRRATRYISSRVPAKVSRPRVSALIVGLCLLLGTPALAQQPAGTAANIERARVHYMRGWDNIQRTSGFVTRNSTRCVNPCVSSKAVVF